MEIRDAHKIEKKNYIGISAFGYENKGKHPVYVSKKFFKDKHDDLSSICEEEKKYYFLIKDFKTFM